MITGLPRSPAWIKRAMNDFQRDNFVTWCVLRLVAGTALTPIDDDVVEAWTAEQCMLAEDWAFAVKHHDSDNQTRVPACPEFLEQYRT